MFRIKKLDLFIAKQFGLLFAGTFFICQFVLMMQFLWRYVDVLIGQVLFERTPLNELFDKTITNQNPENDRQLSLW